MQIIKCNLLLNRSCLNIQILESWNLVLGGLRIIFLLWHDRNEIFTPTRPSAFLQRFSFSSASQLHCGFYSHDSWVQGKELLVLPSTAHMPLYYNDEIQELIARFVSAVAIFEYFLLKVIDWRWAVPEFEARHFCEFKTYSILYNTQDASACA